MHLLEAIELALQRLSYAMGFKAIEHARWLCAGPIQHW